MEQMNHPYLDVVEKCIAFARQFLCLPQQVNIFFEDCPSERFPTLVNPAESDNHGNLWFNKKWFTGEDRWNNHRDDIEFFVFHELRHMHQFCSIRNYRSGKNVSETPETVQKWMQEFSGYIRNIGGESQDANLEQEVEIDANAYGALLTNLYHMDDKIELHFSVPERAMDIAMERAKQYQTKPEIQKFLRDIQRESRINTAQSNIRMPIRKNKIERNGPCPCGSGKKFKKCCIGKGIYD